MVDNLPNTVREFMTWDWPQVEPYYQELNTWNLEERTLAEWLVNWSDLLRYLDEWRWRLYVANTVNTTDQQAKERYNFFLEKIYPPSQESDQSLKEKLITSGLEPLGFEIPLRNMHAQVGLFQQDNLPLLSEELRLVTEYDEIMGAQTVRWQGEEVTLPQLQPVYEERERVKREQAWRLAADRQLADRQAINALWGKFLEVRRKLAANAGLEDYRAYRWKQLLRFDYNPEDCTRFHKAIEEVVVPAAGQLYEKRRKRLGVKTLRPWDLEVDTLGRPALHPFTAIQELTDKVAAIFTHVNPQFGLYFEVMQREDLLDLENRKGKGPGGYCTAFSATRRPFIFTNAVGVHDDVQTLLHEGGHAFHVFETNHLPYFQQLESPLEFAEVASMGMELLASPYLLSDYGGFYNDQQAAQARVQVLERDLLFWPYMAVVDGFQHWVYENPEAADDPQNCDKQWSELWDRFMPFVDWSGLEEEMTTGWQRKEHIHGDPFYYVEYGIAQLGAVQVWRNAIHDQAGAVAGYRKALSLGNTVSLPELYSQAGAKFSFDTDTLTQAVKLMLDTIEELEELQG